MAHAFLAGVLAFPVDSLVKEAVTNQGNLVAFVARMNTRFYPAEPSPA